MNVDRPLRLLADLSPQQFMQRHWQRKPLLVRAALEADRALPVERRRLFELAASEEAESRLVRRDGARWRLAHGPFGRRALPALKTRQWTLLVQGVDALDEAAHEWLQQFRFVPDARLDDLMISFASDGGGVGPHFDRYDVFLFQAHGQRRWRIGRQRDLRLDPDAPLKILRNFEPADEYLLGPGDMLYLPPLWAHEGEAVGECLTYSVGFRAPDAAGLARELLLRLADSADADAAGGRLYRDAAQPAVEAPAAIPQALQVFARSALEKLLHAPHALSRALGEALSEPKPSVWFESAQKGSGTLAAAVRLDRRTRMLYDERHLFINGESLRLRGRDARLLRQLADTRRLEGSAVVACSASTREHLAAWIAAGWLHCEPG